MASLDNRITALERVVGTNQPVIRTTVHYIHPRALQAPIVSIVTSDDSERWEPLPDENDTALIARAWRESGLAHGVLYANHAAAPLDPGMVELEEEEEELEGGR